MGQSLVAEAIYASYDGFAQGLWERSTLSWARLAPVPEAPYGRFGRHRSMGDFGSTEP